MLSASPVRERQLPDDWRTQFESEDRDFRIRALSRGSSLPDSSKLDLAEKALALDSAGLLRQVSRLLSTIERPEIQASNSSLVNLALGQPPLIEFLQSTASVERRAEAVKLAEFLPAAEQAACLRFALDGGEVPLAREAHKLIALYRAPRVLLDRERIEAYLRTDKAFGVQAIQLADSPAVQAELLWRCCNDADPRVRKLAERHIWTVYCYSNSPALVEEVTKRTRVLDVYDPRQCPLFANVPDWFFRAEASGRELEFPKDGSRLLLQGGSRATAEIVRVISGEACAAWRRAFEATKHWRAAGFEYVPVEPILAAEQAKGGLVRVHCEVLDLPLSQVIQYRNFFEFVPRLREQKHRIMEVLRTLGIDHGHPHNNNFCCAFERSSSGRDLSRLPKIYLIDFDQACIQAHSCREAVD